MRCPQCHALNAEGAHFCASCGTGLPRAVHPPAPAPAPVAHTPVASAAGLREAARRFAARPVHVLLLVGVAVCLLSLPFFSYSTPGRVVASPGGYWQDSYTTSGSFAYSTFIPQANFSVIPGSSGSNAPSALPLLLVAAGALWFRRRPWPRWARYTTAVLAALILFTALDGLLSAFGFGALLYLLGSVPVTLAGWRLGRRPAPPPPA